MQQTIDSLAGENRFSGAVRVDRGGKVEFAAAYGLAHRGLEVPNTVETQFAIASGTKGLTAATVVGLIEEGVLDLSTTARSVLGQDLPLIRDDITVEHLRSHRSGIGDYLDEELDVDLDDYLMPIPVHELATTEQYLAVLDGNATKFEPGERFAYCNSGYVVLALIAERVGGTPFHDLVRRQVCEPAGMDGTAFVRSDDLPGRAALGYLIVDGAAKSNVGRGVEADCPHAERALCVGSFEVWRDEDDHVFFKVAEGVEGHPQALVLFDRGVEVGPERSTLDHLAFFINLDEYEARRRQLEGLGLSVTPKEFPFFRWRALFTRDPEGNTVEFVCHDPRLGAE